MKTTLRTIFAVLALARFVGAQAVLGPTTQPAPIDPTAAVNAVNQLAASANAQLSGLNAQLLAVRAQLATSNSQLATAAPKVPWLLVNDEANTYSMVSRWADQTRTACGWYDSSNGKLPLGLSGNGYPLGTTLSAQTYMYMLGAPAGDYAVSWTGHATLAINGLGGVTYKSAGPNSGVLTLPAEGTLGQTPWGIQPLEQVVITCTASDPASPLDNLHVWSPGYGPGSARAGQMYDERYLALVRTYGGVRTMPSSNASGSTETDWSTRVAPTQYDWTTRGVPIEAEIELVKESGVGTWWVCVPARATPDYRQREARLIHDALPNTTLIPEWGNEPWNSGGGFVANAVATAPANPAAYNGTITNGALSTDGADPGGYVRAARVAFDQARACALDFTAAYADRPNQLLPAFNCQSGWALWAQSAYAWGQAKYGSVAPFKILAIAPYLDPTLNNGYFLKPSGPNGTFVVSDLFTASFSLLADGTAAGDGTEYQLAQHAAVAKQYGQELDDYEGGQHFGAQLVNGNYNPADLSTQAQTDPRMGFLYDDYYARLHRAGVRRHCSFALIGSAWGKFGFWSLLQSYEDAASPTAYRWQADVREARRSN